jgi:hypothetical protein
MVMMRRERWQTSALDERQLVRSWTFLWSPLLVLCIRLTHKQQRISLCVHFDAHQFVLCARDDYPQWRASPRRSQVPGNADLPDATGNAPTIALQIVRHASVQDCEGRVLHTEVELDASFHFAGSREAAGVAPRRCGGESRHGACGISVEPILALPSSVPDVEAQPTRQEQSQGTRFASSANPIASEVCGQPGPRQQMRRRPFRAPRDFVANATSVGLQQSW